jgi:hypothetical protein
VQQQDHTDVLPPFNYATGHATAPGKPNPVTARPGQFWSAAWKRAAAVACVLVWVLEAEAAYVLIRFALILAAWH